MVSVASKVTDQGARAAERRRARCPHGLRSIHVWNRGWNRDRHRAPNRVGAKTPEVSPPRIGRQIQMRRGVEQDGGHRALCESRDDVIGPPEQIPVWLEQPYAARR